MNKNLLCVLCAVFACVQARVGALTVDSAAFFHEYEPPREKSYVMNVAVKDWGPVIDSAVVYLGKNVPASAVNAQDFSVGVFGAAAGDKIDIVTGFLDVESAFLSDEYGNEALDGIYVTLHFKTHPEDSLCNPFVSFPVSILKKGVKSLWIKNSALSLNCSEMSAVNCAAVSKFKASFSVTDETVSYYAYFLPEARSESESAAKIPLVVWLHGISEGGTDALAPLLASRIGDLSNDEMQRQFGEGGAAILVPQARTSWLESTTKDAFGNNIWVPVDIDGTVKSIKEKMTGWLSGKFAFRGKEREEEKAPSATVSIYTVALRNLIGEFIENHGEIDENRVYIMGFSAGGYMAVNMCLQYPDFFAAAVPVSEVFPNSKLTSRDIASLSKMPLWFVHSADDSVAKIAKYDGATVQRLVAEGAKDVHYTLYNCIVDSDGVYFDEDGNVFQYSGHDAFIPLFRDEVSESIDGETVSLFEWLSSKSRK